LRIIIDGYNLIHKCSYGIPAHLEEARDMLIADLVRYKKVKSANITVVFDGRESSNLSTTQYRDKGINIIFTMQGITADEKICEMLKGKGDGIVVVSSDRAIRESVENQGAVCVESEIFAQKVQMASMLDLKGTEDVDEIYREKSKKGPSRKKKKKERKRDKIIPKL